MRLLREAYSELIWHVIEDLQPALVNDRDNEVPQRRPLFVSFSWRRPEVEAGLLLSSILPWRADQARVDEEQERETIALLLRRALQLTMELLHVQSLLQQPSLRPETYT